MTNRGAATVGAHWKEAAGVCARGGAPREARGQGKEEGGGERGGAHIGG